MLSPGFSLFELLIAITISAILTFSGVRGWRDYHLRNELSNTTFELIAFFNEVKMDANLHNINHSIHLFETNKTNWCLAVTPKDRPDTCQTKFHFSSSTTNVEIVGFSSKATFIFYGRRSMAQSMTIRLKNSIGESRIIISARGRIRYCSYQTFLAGYPLC